VAEFDYCVVGAGFAGLTAALRLKQAGRSVALLEARDRVGGRTFTVTRDDGVWVDRGGAWIGPGQDRISIAEWLEKSVMSKQAREMLDTLAGPYTTAASETSLLWMLLQQGSAGSPTIGGPTFVISGKGGAQDARPVGGVGAIYRPMVAELGDALHVSQPVRHIAQDDDGVTIRSDDLTVRARRAIVAIKLAIANTISYEPMLPVDRSLLHQRMPGGAVIKISVFYDEPFWRTDGLCGQSVGPGTAATLTIDACTDTGVPGIMCVITEGPAARKLGQLDEADRKAAVVRELVNRFGDKARSPVEFHEQDWAKERYSGGGMISHAPPGVLTELGHALRPPCGRIHWAGTESSDTMCGWIDGAVRSGERAAAEVMAADPAAVA
jgi:monoamine oxidase